MLRDLGPQTVRMESGVPTHDDPEHAASTSAHFTGICAIPEPAVADLDERSTLSQLYSQLIHAFTPSADAQVSGDFPEKEAVVNDHEVAILGQMNEARSELFCALRLAIKPIAEADVAFPCPQWESTLSVLPSLDLTSWAISIQSALDLTRTLLEQQWAKAHDDSHMLDLTKALAVASRDRKCRRGIKSSAC